ncbi:hypothetical protein [Coraliomargarita parva]|uniref:hypothetical protein n=1 Tax=Coraliomargarita parva TaxID=3014050 RepID=UPI0022B3CF51|nr:hypothetical protein [Coraliomargarita parva]
MALHLAQSKCFEHASREAVARCPECGRFYCRECVTEHEGRMVCRGCLDGLLQVDVKPSRGILRGLVLWGFAFAGLCLAVYAFYTLGDLLLRIPSEFHSGAFLDQ